MTVEEGDEVDARERMIKPGSDQAEEQWERSDA